MEDKFKVMKKPKELKERFNNIITEYVELFCIKHDIKFNYWIADRFGEVAEFNSTYYINFREIKHDIDSNVEKDKFFEWYDFVLENHYKDNPYMNYEVYLKLKK